MKTTALIILTLILSMSALQAQQKMTDRDFAGLKGPVKSVLYEITVIRKGGRSFRNQPKNPYSKTSYKGNGQLEKVYYHINDETLDYRVIDGFKTFMNREKNSETEKKNRFTVVGEKPRPIETSEQITKPDSRFMFRYSYEYDNQGRAIVERKYSNTNRLNQLSRFIYNKNNSIIEKKVSYETHDVNSVFLHDADGRTITELIENISNPSGKVSITLVTYTDIKYDKQGNWIERKRTHYFDLAEKVFEVPHGKEPGLEYIDHRTIEYY